MDFLSAFDDAGMASLLCGCVDESELHQHQPGEMAHSPEEHWSPASSSLHASSPADSCERGASPALPFQQSSAQQAPELPLLSWPTDLLPTQQQAISPSSLSSQPCTFALTATPSTCQQQQCMMASASDAPSASAPPPPRPAPGKRGRKPHPRLPDLQQKLDELNEQFQRLSSDNSFLRTKLKVLERVVPLRDESVGSLNQLLSTAAPAHGHASAALAASALGERISMTCALYPPQSPSPSGESNCSWPGAVGAVGASPQSHPAEPCASFARNSSSHSGAAGSACGGRGGVCSTNDVAGGLAAFCSLASHSTGPGLGRAIASAAATFARVRSPSCGGQQQLSSSSLLALCPSIDGEGPAVTSSVAEELRYVAPEQYRVLWRHVCLQLGVLVTGAEVHGPGSPPAVRLERYLRRLTAFLDRLALLSPASLPGSMYTNVETGEPERPNDTFWLTCARSLQLSSQQVAELSSLATFHRQNVAPLVQQRLQLTPQLAVRPAAAQSAASVGSQQDDLVQQLEGGLQREQAAHRDITDYVYSSVLNPLQVAKLMTAAFPLIPDVVAMLHAVEQQVQASTSAAGAAATQQGQLIHTPSSAAAASAAGLAALAGLLSAARQGATASVVAPAPRSAAPAAGLQPAQLQALLAALQAGQLLVRAAA